MKITTYAMVLLFTMAMTSAVAQKYKTAADSIKLNVEYADVLKDINEINEKLISAQAKMPGYQSKAEDADSDAKKAAIKSNEQSSKAIDGDVSDARKAKKKANKALKDAKDVENANDRVKNQEDKIKNLQKQLEKKQEKLQKLEEMRMQIRANVN